MQTDIPRPGATMIARVLIVSYFFALATGQISGTEIVRLASPFLPEASALLVMRGIVLVLAGMVLIGFHRWAAALVLSLVIFWSSYLTLFAGGQIGAFWRDLALIGGLFLTAGIGLRSDHPDGADGEQDGNSARYEDEAFDSPAEFRIDGFRSALFREKSDALRAG